ncbi:hypothetical protein BH11CYA1_BH11CYA1_46720 [soil metagenome]
MPATGPSTCRFDPFCEKHHWLLVLVILALLHQITWGATIAKVGFFTDEWELFGILHFVPHDIISEITRVLQHERFAVRPLLACILGALYYVFGDQPYGYHLLNQIVEILGAFFLYLAINRLCKFKLLAFSAAVLFLLYPNHDISHYHVTAMSAQMALTLFNLCFYLFVCGVQRKAQSYLWFSAICYFLGLSIYELCMPLFFLLAMAAVYILTFEEKSSIKAILRRVFALCLPYIVVLALFVAYRMLILPLIGSKPVYRPGFQWNHFCAVYSQGIQLTLLPQFFIHMGAKAGQDLADGFSRIMAVKVTFGLFAVGCGLFVLKDQFVAKAGNRSAKNMQYLCLFLMGLIAVLLGYAPYSLALDYLPCLDSGYNRINQASSLGASICLAAFICGLAHLVVRRFTYQKIGVALFLLPLTGLFVLASWQYSKAWLASSVMQNRIISQIKNHSAQIKLADSLILAGCPRYVMWAPLFDSVWDFRSMLRIVLNDHEASGGVVSDRMKIEGEQLKDLFGQQLLGKYDFKNMVILVPSGEVIYRVNNAQEFIAIVQRYGFGFDLEQTTIDRWKVELRASQGDRKD